MHGTTDPEDDEVVSAVLTASRVLVSIAARSLADIADEVTLTQYRTLVVLAAQGPQSVSHLAETVGVAPPTASRMCDRLVSKGLLARAVAPDDRRQVRVELTAAGRDLVDEVTVRRRREIRDVVERLGPDECTLLVGALSRFADAAGEVPDREWTIGWAR